MSVGVCIVWELGRRREGGRAEGGLGLFILHKDVHQLCILHMDVHQY